MKIEIHKITDDERRGIEIAPDETVVVSIEEMGHREFGVTEDAAIEEFKEYMCRRVAGLRDDLARSRHALHLLNQRSSKMKAVCEHVERKVRQ